MLTGVSWSSPESGVTGTDYFWHVCVFTVVVVVLFKGLWLQDSIREGTFTTLSPHLI